MKKTREEFKEAKSALDAFEDGYRTGYKNGLKFNTSFLYGFFACGIIIVVVLGTLTALYH